MISLRPVGRCLALASLLSLPALHAAASDYCVTTAGGLTTAIGQAQSNPGPDRIQVVQGTYVGNFIYQANDSLTIEGGYVSGCGSRVVSPANTVIDAGDGSNPVGFALRLYAEVAVSFVVDGLTVRDGRALSTVDPSTMNGGGLWVITPNGTVTISNNLVTANQAYQDGGGVYVFGAHATLRGNTITGNASGFGAGSFFTDCKSVRLENNTITGNNALFTGGMPPGDGGGVYVDTTFPNPALFPNPGPLDRTAIWLFDNTISSNTAVTTGGGVFIFNSATGAQTTTVYGRGNTLQGNSAASGAGFGMSFGPAASVTLSGNTFNGNMASNNGGGIALFWVHLVTLSSNLFHNNTTTNSGGGAYVLEPPGTTPVAADTYTFTNNTFASNAATGGSGFGGGLWFGLRDDSDTGLVYNNILRGNTAGSGAAADLAVDRDHDNNAVFSPLTILDNDFNQAVAGAFIDPGPFTFDGSNLNNVDPQFVNAGAGNYRLQSGSPCRDVGNNAAPGLPPGDRDRAFRLGGTTVDMGAYEFGAVAYHRRHLLDLDADEFSDFFVYHRASGTWYMRTAAGPTTSVSFGGTAYDPVARDYDGDGKTDIAVFHPPSGLWFIRNSSTGNTTTIGFGGTGYTPVPDDYDGDGKADLALYHPPSGLWFILQSTNSMTVTVGYGGSGYAPVPEDYDGDGKTDIAVFHAATGLWFVRRSSDLATEATGYGTSAYTPVPRDYDGDGKADIAVFHPPTGLWFIRQTSTGTTQTIAFGTTGYTPLPGYFDQDGRADAVVYHTPSGSWFVRQSQSGTVLSLGFGGTGFEPQQ